MTHRLRLVMEPWPPNTGEACPASMDHRVRNGVYWAVSSDASGATYLNIMCHAPPATMAFPDSVKQAWNRRRDRSEEHTSELQSLMRNSYAVFCSKTKKIYDRHQQTYKHYEPRI